MTKRLVTLFLVLLLSIESFAAVVGDNDGAAFITKAEFDSLKSNFQSQIDQYNSSIDSKIDGAISGYLAGIRQAKRKTLKPIITNYNDIYWINMYKLFCKYKKWSDRNTLSAQSLTDTWIEPPAERRRNLRDGSQNFFFWRFIFSQQVAGLNLSLSNTENHPWAYGHQIDTGAYWNQYTIPVLHMSLQNEAELELLTSGNTWFNEWTINSVTYNRPMWRNDMLSDGPSGSTTAAYPSDWILELDTNNPIETVPADNTYALQFYLNGTWKEQGEVAHTLWRMRSDDLMNLNVFQRRNAFSANTFDTIVAPFPDNGRVCGSQYFQDGASFIYANGKDLTNQLTYRMMFGRDNNQLVNVLRQNPSTYYSGNLKQFITYSDLPNVSFSINSVSLAGLAGNDKSLFTPQVVSLTSNKPTISVVTPLLERVKFYDIKNAMFKNNGKSLHTGEGLPIVLDVTDAGTLSIEVISGDNVWLRIAPTTTDGGYFATMSNLKVELVTDV